MLTREYTWQDDSGQLNLEIVHADMAADTFVLDVPINHCVESASNVTLQLLCPPMPMPATASCDTDECLDPTPLTLTGARAKRPWVPCSEWRHVADVSFDNATVSSDATADDGDGDGYVSVAPHEQRLVRVRVVFKKPLRSFGVRVQGTINATDNATETERDGDSTVTDGTGATGGNGNIPGNIDTTPVSGGGTPPGIGSGKGGQNPGNPGLVKNRDVVTFLPGWEGGDSRDEYGWDSDNVTAGDSSYVDIQVRGWHYVCACARVCVYVCIRTCMQVYVKW